jgi:hypothetical protein
MKLPDILVTIHPTESHALSPRHNPFRRRFTNTVAQGRPETKLLLEIYAVNKDRKANPMLT